MEWISRTDLNKLSKLCEAHIYECEEAMKDPDASGLEKSLANHQREYMLALSAKLDRIANSKAKRVEIVY